MHGDLGGDIAADDEKQNRGVAANVSNAGESNVADDGGHAEHQNHEASGNADLEKMRKQLEEAEERARNQDAFLDGLYKTIPVGIMQCTVEANPVILNGNPYSFQILGISEESIHAPGGVRVYDTVYPDDIGIVQAENHVLAKKGVSDATASYTHRIITPVGVVKWVSMVSSLGLDMTGRPVFTVMMHDITEVRELQDFEARENTVERRTYRLAMRAAFDRSVFVDLDENRYSVLDSDSFGYRIPLAGDYDELIRVTFATVDPQDQECFESVVGRQALIDAFDSGKTEVQHEFRRIFEDGTKHWIENRELLLRDDESGHRLCIGLVKIIDREHDERERGQKELQEALDNARAANNAKSEFLSRMSHDIRTPLNGIIGMTRIAREHDRSPEIDDCLDKIDRSSSFLLGLVNDVLDMSKAESGKMELHPEPYLMADFDSYIDSVIKPLYEEKNQTFLVKTTPVKTVIPIVDILRFNQIMFNLLSNAVKYTPEGGTISFDVFNKLVPGHKERIIATVSDNGIGMSDEFQKHLFEPFVQERRNDDSSTGSGLGLSIVKRLVDLMGGSISVKSALGEGTTFVVTIDFDYLDAEQATWKEEIAKAKDAPDAGKLEGKHVLLCEDHPLNQEIAMHMLENWGMLATAVEDGQLGLKAFESSPLGYYDAVLMDVRMPVMDGIEATRAIRALGRPDAKIVPIIAMTANAYEDDVRVCLEAGMNAHVAKPVDPDVLMDALVKWCG